MLRGWSAYLALLLATACTDSLNVGEVELEEDAGVVDAGHSGNDGGASVTEDPLERYTNAIVGNWYFQISPEAYITLEFIKKGPRSGAWNFSCSTTSMRSCKDVGTSRDAGFGPFSPPNFDPFAELLDLATGNFYILDMADRPDRAVGVIMAPIASGNFEVDTAGNRLDLLLVSWTRTPPMLRPRPDGGFP